VEDGPGWTVSAEEVVTVGESAGVLVALGEKELQADVIRISNVTSWIVRFISISFLTGWGG
jgi:hypothetical protein